MTDTIATPGPSTIPAHAAHPGADRVTPRVLLGRRAYTVLAWLFALCVAVQVFMAGMAIFIGPAWWNDHRSFVHFFEYVPLLMLGAAFLGQMSTRVKWLSFLALGLVGLQYGFIAMGSSSVPALAALHPVNALLIFWLAVRLATGRTGRA